MRKKKAQQYTAAEFEAVVALIRADAGVAADIEAITGQSLDDKTPRQLFELFVSIGQAADVQTVVARYGQARQSLRQVRAQLAEPVEVEPAAAAHITRLETQLAELKAANTALRQTNKALLNGSRQAAPMAAPVAGRVLTGKVVAQ